MEPTQEIVNDIYQRRVRRARQRPLSHKLLSGAELFEEACRRMQAGIRLQYPHLDAVGQLHLIRRRLERLRQIRERA